MSNLWIGAISSTKELKSPTSTSFGSELSWRFRENIPIDYLKGQAWCGSTFANAMTYFGSNLLHCREQNDGRLQGYVRNNAVFEEAFCLIKIRTPHQSINHFQYQIIQPTQFFETTLFPRCQKLTSIRQSLPISNQSAETVLWNNAVPEKSKV